MKIGVAYCPYGSGYSRFGKAKFSKMAEHGFSAFDFGMMGTELDIYSMDDSELQKEMLSIKADADEANIEISQVHGPWRCPPMDSTVEERAERMEKMKKSILAASFLGCKHYVIHPIMPYGLDEAGTDDAQRTFDINLSFMTELAGYAKEKNVIVCLENMPMRNFSLSTPDKILELVKAVNSDNFKICLDTGHVAVFKELSAGDVVRMLGNEIKVLHVHDNMGDADYHLWPTKGKTDWDDFAKALKEIDFKGVFSLETLPPSSLEDAEFESECIKLYNISKEILNKANI